MAYASQFLQHKSGSSWEDESEMTCRGKGEVMDSGIPTRPPLSEEDGSEA
jgi:hypothetical protein